ncbi:hypothetical protein [Bacillus atrophaeus]|uniref:hypothetical protein n=1 Tax=Bacillus atrophaeus TaxID=1452 RepID=UPI00227FC8B1|nr:hypothetical protein [Bacillus atrophaeus]MCY8519326.1 hypothetical protein [Bacillus atrophaeus]
MKKTCVMLLSLVLLVSMLPFSALASTESSEYDMITVSGKDVKNTEVLVEAINELDDKLEYGKSII